MEGYEHIKEEHKRKYNSNSFKRDSEELTKKESFTAQTFICLGIFIMLFLISLSIGDEGEKTFSSIGNIIKMDKTEDFKNLINNLSQNKNFAFTIDKTTEGTTEDTIEDTTKDTTKDITKDITDINDNINMEDYNTNFQIDEELLNSFKEEWTLPISSGIITSLYGQRIHPITKKKSNHMGVDISNEKGTNIFSISSGVVDESKYSNSYGNYIVISSNEYEFLYAHLDKAFVNTGDKVKTGDKIGLMGETGNVTGVHLHLELKKNNAYIDPYYLVKNLELEK